MADREKRRGRGKYKFEYLKKKNWDFTLLKECETHKQLKKRKTFWQHQLKTAYPLGLHKKEE